MLLKCQALWRLSVVERREWGGGVKDKVKSRYSKTSTKKNKTPRNRFNKSADWFAENYKISLKECKDLNKNTSFSQIDLSLYLYSKIELLISSLKSKDKWFRITYVVYLLH